MKTEKQQRFTVSWDAGRKDFASYKSAFDFYMKLREGKGFHWLYVYDEEKQKYLICENCIAK